MGIVFGGRGGGGRLLYGICGDFWEGSLILWRRDLGFIVNRCLRRFGKDDFLIGF